ncbi:hypothetical protein DAI22_04g157000 [Oryza sativa Japonica Group]|uniref:B1358B12.14 protein n=1 Tax=Oryza sativa subsp. japonica TaxID=39947 RepID=Q6MWD9_ORYSJ|nr:hypothetical protein DAI22_04g157000 [Oryza sativa Japonica Group]CAE76005.1 B1358B12.14 [Oryza sativa Japonica Group]
MARSQWHVGPGRTQPSVRVRAPGAFDKLSGRASCDHRKPAPRRVAVRIRKPVGERRKASHAAPRPAEDRVTRIGRGRKELDQNLTAPYGWRRKGRTGRVLARTVGFRGGTSPLRILHLYNEYNWHS